MMTKYGAKITCSLCDWNTVVTSRYLPIFSEMWFLQTTAFFVHVLKDHFQDQRIENAKEYLGKMMAETKYEKDDRLKILKKELESKNV